MTQHPVRPPDRRDWEEIHPGLVGLKWNVATTKHWYWADSARANRVHILDPIRSKIYRSVKPNLQDRKFQFFFRPIAMCWDVRYTKWFVTDYDPAGRVISCDCTERYDELLALRPKLRRVRI